jgi:hypothetical protein
MTPSAFLSRSIFDGLLAAPPGGDAATRQQPKNPAVMVQTADFGSCKRTGNNDPRRSLDEGFQHGRELLKADLWKIEPMSG